jgi:anti-sigma-K factor RskA
LAAALYFSGRERQYLGETMRLRNQLEAATTRVTEWQEARPILESPAAVAAAFGTGDADAPSGRVFASPGQGVVLMASHLPPPGSGKTYQMWLMQPGKRPLPAGVFVPEEDGSAMHVKRGAGNALPGDTLFVTVEDEGGASQPARQPLLTVSIPAIRQP